MTKKSVAEDLLRPSKLSFTDEPRKLYIGRLPTGLSDEMVERVLRCCGDLKSWKRSRDASGEPKGFGYAEYDNYEAVYTVIKLMNNRTVTALGKNGLEVPGGTSRLLVKADEKTTQFLNGWIEIKKSEWINKMSKLGV
jgi:RNA-binding protein 25